MACRVKICTEKSLPNVYLNIWDMYDKYLMYPEFWCNIYYYVVGESSATHPSHFVFFMFFWILLVKWEYGV